MKHNTKIQNMKNTKHNMMKIALTQFLDNYLAKIFNKH